MLESKDAVLVSTTIAFSVLMIVSLLIDLERQRAAVGHWTLSKCELHPR